MNKFAIIAIIIAILAIITTAQAPDKEWNFMFVAQAYNRNSPTFEIEAYNLPVSYGETFILNANITGIVVNRNTGLTIPTEGGTETVFDVIKLDIITQYVINATAVRDITTKYIPLNNTSSIENLAIAFPTRKEYPTSSHRLFFTVLTNEISDNAAISFTLEQTGGHGEKYTFVPKTPFTIPGFSTKFADAVEVKYLKPNKKEGSPKDYDKTNGGFELKFTKLSDQFDFDTTTLKLQTNGGSGVEFVNVGDQAAATCTFKWKSDSFEPDFNTKNGGMVWSTVQATDKVIPAGQDLTIHCPSYDIAFTNTTLTKRPLTFDFTAFIETGQVLGQPQYNYTALSTIMPKFEDARESGGLSGVAIFFIIICVIIVICIIAYAGYAFWKKNHSKKNHERQSTGLVETYQDYN